MKQLVLGTPEEEDTKNSVLSNDVGRRMSKKPKQPTAGLILRGSPGQQGVPIFTKYLRCARLRCITLKAFKQVKSLGGEGRNSS